MTLLSIANLKLSVGRRILLDGVNLTLADGEHIGLVGRNGCGKSCLLRAIAGTDTLLPSGGQVQVQRGINVGMLTQDPQLDPDKSLRQEAAGAFSHLEQLHQRLESLSHKMADAHGDQLTRLLKQYEKVEHAIEAGGGYAVDHRIDATLHGLGLDDGFFQVKVADLSGGQQGRLALAKLLLKEPDLLLLDEPTNHLDIDGCQWLERFLAGYRGAVILVSHDRWLLDHVVSRIYELEEGRLFDYPGNYTTFRTLRAERRISYQRAYDKQQQTIKHQQQFIERYRAGQRAKQARGREKRLERFIENERIDRPVELDDLHIQIKPAARAGDIVISCHEISKHYGDKILFDRFSITIKRGDRIGIIGPNGAGKSTLAYCLLGEMDHDTGQTKLGAQVDVGLYRQTHDHLDMNQSLVQYLQRHVPSSSEQEARDLAGAFLLTGMEQDKLLKDLSGGERSRGVLAGLLVQGHNLLVLDEPTNHLDIPSVEKFEEALLRFTARDGKTSGTTKTNPGTLIIITHDRMLLEDMVDQLLIFDGQGHVRHHLGSYSEYAQARQSQADPPPSKAKKAQPGHVKTSAPHPNKNTLHLLSQQKLESQIEQIETELARLDQQLADPTLYRDPQAVTALQQQRKKLTEQLAPLEADWSRRAQN